MVVAEASGGVSPSERLKPYVPLLVIDWLREIPGARHRALDSSLAFVDISGFTQLTEKLARRGKVGAEQGPGEFFGELSLLVPESARVARVRAKTPVPCLAIDRAAFEELLETEPSLALAMLRVIARRLWHVMRSRA